MGAIHRCLGGPVSGPARARRGPPARPPAASSGSSSAPSRRAGEPGASGGSDGAPGARAKGRSLREPSWYARACCRIQRCCATSSSSRRSAVVSAAAAAFCARAPSTLGCRLGGRRRLAREGDDDPGGDRHHRHPGDPSPGDPRDAKASQATGVAAAPLPSGGRARGARGGGVVGLRRVVRAAGVGAVGAAAWRERRLRTHGVSTDAACRTRWHGSGRPCGRPPLVGGC